MKVAIIGAGLSGLSAAFEFKKNGIIPVIFEKNSYLGQNFRSPLLTLNVFDRFHRGPSFYLKQKYGLDIRILYIENNLRPIGDFSAVA